MQPDSLTARLRRDAQEWSEAEDWRAGDTVPLLREAADELDRAYASNATVTKAWYAARKERDKAWEALKDLLAIAERIRGGDSSLDLEEWYAVRDFARVTLASAPDTTSQRVRDQLLTGAAEAYLGAERPEPDERKWEPR